MFASESEEIVILGPDGRVEPSVTDFTFIKYIHQYSDLWKLITKSKVVCCPLTTSLPYQHITKKILRSHILTPGRFTNEYISLNNEVVRISENSIIYDVGSRNTRRVKIIDLFYIHVNHNHNVLMYIINRPLIGGLDAPDDADEITSACMRKYTTLLRSFPDIDEEFIEIDGFIKHLKFLQLQSKSIPSINDSGNNYDVAGKDLNLFLSSLPSVVHKQWKLFSSRLLLIENVRVTLSQIHGALATYVDGIVESYIISNTFDFLYSSLNDAYSNDDRQFTAYITSYQFHSQSDFGIRPELQCIQADAIEVLSKLSKMKTPAEKMIVLMETSKAVERAIQKNIKTVFAHSDDSIECATDDIIMILLYTVSQCTDCHSCLAPDLRFIQEYHFVNSSTSVAGFSFCHFQIVLDWLRKRFLLCREELLKSRQDCARKSGDRGNFSKTDSDFEITSDSAITAPDVKEPICLFISASERNRKWIALAQSQIDSNQRGIQSNSNVMDTTDNEADEKVATISEISIPVRAPEANLHGILSTRSSSNYLDEGRSNKLCIARLGSHLNSDCNDGLSVQSLPIDVLWKRARISSSCAGTGFYSFSTSNGEVFTWGMPDSGRLGMSAGVECDSFQHVAVPRILDIGSTARVIRLSCGKAHMLAVTEDGTVLAWGDNRCGQLGFTDTASRQHSSLPRVIEALQSIKMTDIACGAYHSLGLSSDAHVYSWGRAADGRLGQFAESLCLHDEDVVGDPNPVLCDWTLDPCKQQIMRATACDRSDEAYVQRGSVVAIAAGFCHSLAVTADGVLFSWGRGTFGRLGHGSHCHEYIPRQVLSLSLAGVSVKAVSAGLTHTLIMDSHGLLYGCGDNAHGQLAGLVPIRRGEFDYKLDRTAILCAIPVPLVLHMTSSQHQMEVDTAAIEESTMTRMPDNLVLVRKISCGALHSAAVTANGDVLVWGGCGPLVSAADNGSSSEFGSASSQICIVTSLGGRISGSVEQIACGGSDILVITTSS